MDTAKVLAEFEACYAATRSGAVLGAVRNVMPETPVADFDAASSDAAKTDFDRWIVEEFEEPRRVHRAGRAGRDRRDQGDAACSTYFNVIGTEIDWAEIMALFADSGQDWSGASFFSMTAPTAAPLDNPTVRLKLRELEARLDQDRLVLNEGRFFDKRGCRLKIEEVQVQ